MSHRIGWKLALARKQLTTTCFSILKLLVLQERFWMNGVNVVDEQMDILSLQATKKSIFHIQKRVQ